eukprot:SAG11_NODE_29168_length_314_cov_0.451163_1_plen_86_part_10
MGDVDLGSPEIGTAVAKMNVTVHQSTNKLAGGQPEQRWHREVKGFVQPPPLVMFTMEAVCILQGVKRTGAQRRRLFSVIQTSCHRC